MMLMYTNIGFAHQLSKIQNISYAFLNKFLILRHQISLFYYYAVVSEYFFDVIRQKRNIVLKNT